MLVRSGSPQYLYVMRYKNEIYYGNLRHRFLSIGDYIDS